jgi:hypothetical protein
VYQTFSVGVRSPVLGEKRAQRHAICCRLSEAVSFRREGDVEKISEYYTLLLLFV